LSKKSETTRKTILLAKKNNEEPIQIFTDLNNGELIDQTKNINFKYTKVTLINNNIVT